jgi:hypothetical protein
MEMLLSRIRLFNRKHTLIRLIALACSFAVLDMMLAVHVLVGVVYALVLMPIHVGVENFLMWSLT